MKKNLCSHSGRNSTHRLSRLLPKKESRKEPSVTSERSHGSVTNTEATSNHGASSATRSKPCLGCVVKCLWCAGDQRIDVV
jgi:hypothetical protein